MTFAEDLLLCAILFFVAMNTCLIFYGLSRVADLEHLLRAFGPEPRSGAKQTTGARAS